MSPAANDSLSPDSDGKFRAGVPISALLRLLREKSVGEWVRLDDRVSQPNGYLDVAPPETEAMFEADGTDDFTDDADVAATISNPGGVMRNWCGGCIIQRPSLNDLRIWIGGGGGHAGWGGNEPYDFDLNAAAQDILDGGNGGTWRRPSDPSKLAQTAYGSYPYVYPPNDPNGSQIADWYPHPNAAGFLGPIATHTYGNVQWDEANNRVVLWGEHSFDGGQTDPGGAFVMDPDTMEWETPPAGGETDPGVTENGYWKPDATSGSSVMLPIPNSASYQFWHGSKGPSAPLRFNIDTGAYETQADGWLAGRSGSKRRAAPNAGPDPDNPGDLAAFSWSDDTDVVIWHQIDVDGASANQGTIPYTNNPPFTIDPSTGVYIEEHDAHFFVEELDQASPSYRIARADIQPDGVGGFEVVWSTHIDPVTPLPGSMVQVIDNSVWGRFRYLVSHKCFVLSCDGNDGGRVYVLKEGEA